MPRETKSRRGARSKKSTRGTTNAHQPGGIPTAYLLLALGLLVFVVSMPRFRAQVLRDNTAEARDTLLLVGEVAQRHGHHDLRALLEEEASLRHRMPDARPSSSGRRTQVHGYWFDDVRLMSGGGALGAWPVEFGRTGQDAWIVTDDGRVFRHANGGQWTGEARPLRHVDLSRGWKSAP